MIKQGNYYYFDVKEVSAATQIPEYTLKKMIRNGQLFAVKHVNKYFISQDEVREHFGKR